MLAKSEALIAQDAQRDHPAHFERERLRQAAWRLRNRQLDDGAIARELGLNNTRQVRELLDSSYRILSDRMKQESADALLHFVEEQREIGRLAHERYKEAQELERAVLEGRAGLAPLTHGGKPISVSPAAQFKFNDVGLLDLAAKTSLNVAKGLGVLMDRSTIVHETQTDAQRIARLEEAISNRPDLRPILEEAKRALLPASTTHSGPSDAGPAGGGGLPAIDGEFEYLPGEDEEGTVPD